MKWIKSDLVKENTFSDVINLYGKQSEVKILSNYWYFYELIFESK